MSIFQPEISARRFAVSGVPEEGTILWRVSLLVLIQ